MGNMLGAVSCLDEAQSLDTADRYVNCKCTKYMLRAGQLEQAQLMAAKFTRVAVVVVVLNFCDEKNSTHTQTRTHTHTHTHTHA